MSGGWFFEDIQRSLKLNPHHIDSWIHYAGYYASSIDENDKTVEILNELLKYKPKDDESPSLFEYVMKNVQKYTDDDAPMKKRMPNPPYFDTKYIRQYCGEWLIAVAYYWKNKKFYEAYEALKKAISSPRNKNMALLWYFHLVLNLAKEEYIKAIEFGEKAVELDPKFKYAWQQLGKSYYLKGDYNQALNCIGKALQLDKFFEPALELNKNINSKLEEIKRLEKKKVFSYQRQQLSKEERDFLLDLEKECEKPIPVISDVNWDSSLPKLGFVTRNGHIVELGLNGEAMSIIKIPESIGNLKHLEKLSITSLYHLQKFPESIIYLKNLKFLQYEHSVMPLNPAQELKQGILPKIICELKSIEELYLGAELIVLPEELVYSPNLKKIKLSPMQKFEGLPLIIREYFEYQELRMPKRKFLIRKKPSPKRDKITPKVIYNQFKLKIKSESESIKDLINLIEKSDILETKIKGIKLLKNFASKSEKEFKFLKRLMNPVPNAEYEYPILLRIVTTDPSILIKIAAIDVILYKFADIAYESIKSVIMNEKALQVNEFVRKAILNSDAPGIQQIKNEFQDILIIKEIEKLIGQPLRELTNFEVIKKKHYGIQGPHGYIKKGNRITHLGLLMNSPVQQHDLTSLPNNIGDLNHLEELELTYCQHLTNLPEEIGQLKNLRKLVLNYCTILNSLPKNIGYLENLETLKISNCYSLKRLPPTISKLKKLKVLELTDCWSFISLLKGLEGLDSLEVLNLKNCRSLKYLPESIRGLQNLKEINLEKCGNIEKLPSDIGKIKSLETLKVKSLFHLKEIPNSIGNLEYYKMLDFSFCYSLTELPDTLGDLRNLQNLILKGCRELKSIPESLGNLENLEELNLYACRKLTSLPNSIGKLKNLKKLTLSYSDSLSSIPDSVENLKNLEYVNLEGCSSLNSVPENIVVLYKLRELNKKTSPNMETNNKFHYDNLDLQLKEYQQKRYSELRSIPIILTEKVQNLIKNGVDPEDSEILIRIFRFLEWDLDKSEITEDLDKDQGDMWPLHHYKINRNGKVIELHLHHGNSVYLTLFPEYLCTLDCLEVIRFPNNLIETIPECITNLKSLRALELSNVEQPNPAVPESIKSFIKSLEIYNSF
jgi:leucine-rich repeat protein SHOC2